MQFNRITIDPAVMQGKACIRGTRVTVSMLVGQLGAGGSIDEILRDHPYLEREDVLEALLYASLAVNAAGCSPEQLSWI